jgi:ABC-type polysaccharide/polyol phosphate transport system ATPase subunit
MTQPVIQVRDLSKSYQIRKTTKKPYHSLRDDLMDGFKDLVKGRLQPQETETFWALNDITVVLKRKGSRKITGIVVKDFVNERINATLPIMSI